MIVTRQAFDNYRRPPIRFSRRGPASSSLKALTASASGSVNNVPNRASQAASIPKLTNAAVGAMGLIASSQNSIRVPTEVAVGNIGVKGAATASLPTVTVALLGQIGTVSPGTGAGVATDTLQAFTETSQGIIGVSARVTNSLQTLTAAAQGTYVAPGIQGTATDTLRPFSLPSQTFPSAVSGTATGSLPVLTCASNPATNLVHNSTFTVTGSGFSTKESTTKPTIADYGDAGAGVLDSQWDASHPSAVSSSVNVLNRAIPHTQNSTSSGVPHNNCSVAVSCNPPGGNPSGDTQNGCMIRNFSQDSLPRYSYWSFYHRMSSNWVFGLNSPADDNYKTFGYRAGHDDLIDTNGNWYEAYNPDISHSDHTAFWNGTDVPLVMTINDDQGFRPADGGSGILTFAGHWSDGTVGAQASNFVQGWTKVEILIKWTADSNSGYFKSWHDGRIVWNNYQTATDDPSNSNWSPSARCEGLGGFQRDCNSKNWRYWVDIYHSRDPNPGRFILTNSSTWSDAGSYPNTQIREAQPYTSWSSTSVTLKCKKGKLSSGTVHLHYRDEVNGHQYIGAYTMT